MTGWFDIRGLNMRLNIGHQSLLKTRLRYWARSKKINVTTIKKLRNAARTAFIFLHRDYQMDIVDSAMTYHQPME